MSHDERFSRHRSYAAVQPRDGETILVCGHVGSGRKFHWFGYDGMDEFTRPDGTTGQSRWIAICEQCFSECEDPVDVIRDDITWTGDEPEIRQMRPS